MSASGPRPERTPENDIRLIANCARRLGPILKRLTAEEIRALSDEDRQFLTYWADHAGPDLVWARDTARGYAAGGLPA